MRELFPYSFSFDHLKNDKDTYRMGLWVSVWFAVAILIFKPFGIRFEYTDVFFISLILSYAALAGIVFLFNEFFVNGFIGKYIKSPFSASGKLISWYIYQSLSMLFLSMLFFELIIVPVYHIASVELALLALKVTFFIMLPILVTGNYYFKTRPVTNYVTFKTTDKEPDLIIPIFNVLYVEGQDNYLGIHYLNDKGILTRKLIRSTMAKQEKHLESKGIRKCHRSYMVNTALIECITGNKKNLRISIKGADQSIPVSRNYLGTFYPMKKFISPQK